MLRLIGCAVALAAICGARGAQYEGSCILQLGLDFRGNDFSNTKKDSAEKCDIPCLEEPRCTHFTYANGRCYLKSSGDGEVVSDGAISGVCAKTNHITVVTSSSKVFRCDLAGQQEIQGSSLNTFKANSYAKCAQACHTQSECDAFTYKGTRCSLKTAQPDTASVFNSAAVSGNCSLLEEEGGLPDAAGIESEFTAEDCDFSLAVEYIGGDVEGTFALAGNQEQCANLCIANSACKVFSYRPASKKCHLKYSIVSLETNAAGVVSGDCSAKPGEPAPPLLDPRNPYSVPGDSKWPSDPNVWIQGKRIPSKMGEVSAAVMGDHLFVFGNDPATTFDYNIVTKSWSYGPARPYAGSHQVTFVIGTEMYVVGGFKEGSERMTQVYSHVTNRWRIAPNYPGIGLGSYVGVGVEGCLYVCSGLYFESDNLYEKSSDNQNHNPNDCYRYDSYSQGWAQFTNIPIGINHGAAGAYFSHFSFALYVIACVPLLSVGGPNAGTAAVSILV